jgi:HEAT repeat protein
LIFLSHYADISHLVAELHDPTIKKRRAAAIQLGKSGNLSAIPPLIEALSDNHPLVRCDSVQALGRLGDSSAVAIAAIGKIKDRDAVDPLIRCLCDKEIIIRIGAAEVLGKLGDRRAIKPLKKLADDQFSAVREAAAEALLRLQVRS